MTRTLRSIRLAAALAFSVVCGVSAQTPQPFRALFVGNSYTYYNDLPMVIADLAAAANESRRFEPHVVLVGGSTLEAHIARKAALDEIARGKWDAVIVQEQSTRPITDPGATMRDIRVFADAAKRVGAKLVMYETWAREVAPQTQDSLTHVLHAAASSVGASIAHAGEAWRAFREQEETPAGTHSVLFQTDGSHPSALGTHLAASAFYATLYGKSPVGLPATSRPTTTQPPPGPAPDVQREPLDPKLARMVQELAWKAARP
jgi:hypothetical protein